MIDYLKGYAVMLIAVGFYFKLTLTYKDLKYLK